MNTDTTNIPEILDEPTKAGCAAGLETLGYFAGEISRLRGIVNAAGEKTTDTNPTPSTTGIEKITSRFFEHVTGFGYNTLQVEIRSDGKGFCHLTDGHVSDCDITPEDAERFVQGGLWKEVFPTTDKITNPRPGFTIYGIDPAIQNELQNHAARLKNRMNNILGHDNWEFCGLTPASNANRNLADILSGIHHGSVEDRVRWLVNYFRTSQTSDKHDPSDDLSEANNLVCENARLKNELERRSLQIHEACKTIAEKDLLIHDYKVENAKLKAEANPINHNGVPMTREQTVDCLNDFDDKLTNMTAAYEDACNQMENWQNTAQEYCRNAHYYRSLLELVGSYIGKEAFTCDDGTHADSVLVDKVPELVARLTSQGTDPVARPQ